MKRTRHSRTAVEAPPVSLALVLLISSAGSSCAKQASTASAPTPATRRSTSSAPKAATAEHEREVPATKVAADKPPPTPVLVPRAFPGNEEHGSFRLSWRSAGTAELRAGPGREQPVVGSARFRSKARIKVTDTALLVTRPRRVVAKQAEEIPASLYQPDPNAPPAPMAKLKIPAGRAYYYYHYLGEGDSLLGFEGKLYYASCSASETMPTQLTAEAHQWWVELKKGKLEGWIEVDKRLMNARVAGP